MSEVKNEVEAKNEDFENNPEVAEQKKTISIDPNILIDCIEYTNAILDGYKSIYQNFQKILWTMRKRGVPAADAAAATVEIMERASKRASAMVPHKDPFEELPSDDEET